MADERNRRKLAAEIGGGVAFPPEIERVRTREPEVIHVPEQAKHTVVIPTLAHSEQPIMANLEQFIGADYATVCWITERTEVDVSDIERPVIRDIGYERIYIMRVWMTTAEYDGTMTYIGAKEAH